MKKIVALLLVLVLCMGMTSALADKMGTYLYTTVSSAANAGEKDGSYEINTNVCTIVLDDNGVIKMVNFDVAQTKVGFTAAGVATTEVGTVVPSKAEKGDAYNMKVASPIGKDWYEQADALEAWCIGKTVDQVLTMPVMDRGDGSHTHVPTDVDLAAGCTISVADHLKALEKAAANAK